MSFRSRSLEVGMSKFCPTGTVSLDYRNNVDTVSIDSLSLELTLLLLVVVVAVLSASALLSCALRGFSASAVVFGTA